MTAPSPVRPMLRKVRMTALQSRIEETRAAACRAARDLVDDGSDQVHVGDMATVGPCRISAALAAFQHGRPGVELLLHDVWSAPARELLLAASMLLAAEVMDRVRRG